MLNWSLLLLLLLPPLSWARLPIPPKRVCSTVDLRGPKLGPVRHQDSIGWCSAFALADMVSYRLGKKISAAHIAQVHRKTWEPRIRASQFKEDQLIDLKLGLHPSIAMENLKPGGFCLESEVPSEDNANGQYLALLEKLSSFKKELNTYNKVHNEEQACSILKSLFPNLDPKLALNVLKASSNYEYFSDLVMKSCKSRVPGNHLELEDNIRPDFDRIDSILNRKDVVGINFNPHMLGDKNVARISSEHSTLLVGRRFNPKTRTCEYLMRNSWGPSPLYYDKSYDVEDGHIWIPQSVLKANTHAIFYLK